MVAETSLKADPDDGEVRRAALVRRPPSSRVTTTTPTRRGHRARTTLTIRAKTHARVTAITVARWTRRRWRTTWPFT